MKNGVYKYKNGRICERLCERMYIRRNDDYVLCSKVVKNLHIGETAVFLKDDKIDIIAKHVGDPFGDAYPQIPLCPDTLELMFNNECQNG